MEKTRQTKQKQLILDVLRQASAPVTANELYRRAAEDCPTLAKSTVYRNLEAMARRGEVSRGWLENGESFFSIAGSEHHHYMICLDCNRMQDLPSCPMKHLEEQLENLPGFVPVGHVVQVYGYCRDCASRHEREKENKA